MAQAPRSDQLALLDVAEIDSAIARLERENTKHPLREKLGTLLNSTAATARERDAAEVKVSVLEGDLATAEATCAKLQEQIHDKEEKLNSGVGLTSRDLLVLQDEIASLRVSLEAASETEFAALDSLEVTQGEVARLEGDIAELGIAIEKYRAELEETVARIEMKQTELRAQRAVIYEPLAEELKKIYEHSRASGGYAVMALAPNGQTGQGVVLSPVEVAQIRSLPEEEIYLSEDYDAIIIRVDEL